MSLAPPFSDEGRRCFSYCGDEHCVCPLGTQRIVQEVSGAFRDELSGIYRKRLAELRARRARRARVRELLSRRAVE